jgi:colanic acid/amylovoran biosynthesis glycosyltransferase
VKIAYLVSQFPAPSHTFIRREVEALRRRGLSIDTFSIRPGEALSEADRQDLARTFTVLPAPKLDLLRNQATMFLKRPGSYLSTLQATLQHRIPGSKNLLWALFYFVEAMRLAEELDRRGITHVHNHFANPASHVGLAATRYLGIGWSVSLHGLGDYDGPTTVILPDKVSAARFIACVTYYGRAQTMRVCDPALWEKLFVSRCGIEVERLPPVKPRPPRERLRILSVGRLSPEKGQVGLVEAFALARAKGLNAELILIGGGPDEARIKEAVQKFGVADRVELRGRQPEAAVLEAMADADLFVLSSFVEGLPVVLMEALGLELPVIAPAITGVPELVEHNRTGLLFAAGHWAELAERILEYAGDPEQRAAHAKAGRQKVLAEFDIERAVEPLLQHFEAATY